jgi:prepilin-type N-terminal cleavage/methylation domain-containing protein
MHANKSFLSSPLSKVKNFIDNMKEKGYTLLEVVIAAGILAISLAGITAVFLSSMYADEYSQKLTIAYKAAQEVMEQLLAMQWEELALQDGVEFEVLGLGIPDPKIGLISITDLSEEGGRLYEITVSIDHEPSDGTGPIKLKLITRRAKP